MTDVWRKKMTDVWRFGQALPKSFQELREFKLLPQNIQQSAVNNSKVTLVQLELDYQEDGPQRRFAFVITDPLFTPAEYKSAIKFLQKKFPQLNIPDVDRFGGYYRPASNVSVTRQFMFFDLYYSIVSKCAGRRSDITIEQFKGLLQHLTTVMNNVQYYLV